MFKYEGAKNNSYIAKVATISQYRYKGTIECCADSERAEGDW